MSNQKSSSSKTSFESSHGATRKITAAQKLAEIVCERIAIKEGKLLGVRFWNTPQWRSHYYTQIRFANKLLKLYSHEVIFKALHDSPRIWSLGASFFIDSLELAENSYKAELARAKNSPQMNIETNNTLDVPRKNTSNKNSMRSKLNRLNGKN